MDVFRQQKTRTEELDFPPQCLGQASLFPDEGIQATHLPSTWNAQGIFETPKDSNNPMVKDKSFPNSLKDRSCFFCASQEFPGFFLNHQLGE